MIVFMMFVILVALICINVPIAVGLAVSAIFGLAVTEGLDSIVTLALDMYDGSTKFSLIAIPMFVLCLLYTSPSPRDLSTSRMPSSA